MGRKPPAGVGNMNGVTTSGAIARSPLMARQLLHVRQSLVITHARLVLVGISPSAAAWAHAAPAPALWAVRSSVRAIVDARSLL
jgi:hypothetical protein